MVRILYVVLATAVAGFAASASAQQGLGRGPGDAVVGELMRKALAGENENGFCATTAWQIRESRLMFPLYKQWLGREGRGAWQWRESAACTTALVVRVGSAGGRRCLATRAYFCLVGGACRSAPGDWCPTGTGDFQRCTCE